MLQWNTTPAWLGGKVQDQAAFCGSFQFRWTKEQCGNGVDDQVKPMQAAAAQKCCAEAHGLRPGQLLITAGGHADFCAQGGEALSGDPADPAETKNEDPGTMDGDGEVFHCQLEGAFGGGHGVGNYQLFLSKGVVKGEIELLGDGMSLGVDLPPTEKLTGG